MSMEDIHKAARQMTANETEIYSARIEKSQPEVVRIMEKQLKDAGVSLKGNIPLTHSINAANYSINQQTDSSVTNFNIQLLGNSITNELGPGSRYTIFTYQQVKSPEILEMLTAALEDYFKDLKEIRAQKDTFIKKLCHSLF